MHSACTGGVTIHVSQDSSLLARGVKSVLAAIETRLSGKTHQNVVLAHDLIQECVARAEVGGEDCVLVSWAAALHLHAEDITLVTHMLLRLCGS